MGQGGSGTDRAREATPRLAAYHEAGHAVAACFRPRAGRTTRVTIRPADLAEGDAGVHWSTLEPGAAADEECARASAVVSLAGPEVDRRLIGAELTCGSADYEAVRELLFRAFFDREIEEAAASVARDDLGSDVLEALADSAAARIEEDYKRLLDELRAEAAALVAEKWPQIEAVAEALLRQGSLDGEEVVRIVATAEAAA